MRSVAEHAQSDAASEHSLERFPHPEQQVEPIHKPEVGRAQVRAQEADPLRAPIRQSLDRLTIQREVVLVRDQADVARSGVKRHDNLARAEAESIRPLLARRFVDDSQLDEVASTVEYARTAACCLRHIVPRHELRQSRRALVRARERRSDFVDRRRRLSGEGVTTSVQPLEVRRTEAPLGGDRGRSASQPGPDCVLGNRWVSSPEHHDGFQEGREHRVEVVRPHLTLVEIGAGEQHRIVGGAEEQRGYGTAKRNRHAGRDEVLDLEVNIGKNDDRRDTFGNAGDLSETFETPLVGEQLFAEEEAQCGILLLGLAIAVTAALALLDALKACPVHRPLTPRPDAVPSATVLSVAPSPRGRGPSKEILERRPAT